MLLLNTVQGFFLDTQNKTQIPYHNLQGPALSGAGTILNLLSYLSSPHPPACPPPWAPCCSPKQACTVPSQDLCACSLFCLKHFHVSASLLPHFSRGSAKTSPPQKGNPLYSSTFSPTTPTLVPGFSFLHSITIAWHYVMINDWLIDR